MSVEYNGKEYLVKSVNDSSSKKEFLTLDLSGKKITNIKEIKGLSELKELEILNLYNNKITEIKGLKNLKNLKILFLNKNKIKEIKGLQNLENLLELYLDNNNISELYGLSNLKNLQVLTLIKNPLHDLLAEKFKAVNFQEDNIKQVIEYCKRIDEELKRLEDERKLKEQRRLKEKLRIEAMVRQDNLEELKNRIPRIEEYIQNRNYSAVILELKKLKDDAIEKDLEEIIDWVDITTVSIIKKTVLDLGTKFPRLQVIEIAEECGVENDLIISTLKEMITHKEIYAKYFESSQSVAFDQQANIDDIDKLLSAYKEWEEEGVAKKG